VIHVGSFDDDVPQTGRDAYVKEVEEITRVPVREIAEGSDKLVFASHTPDAQSPMSIAAIQQALKSAGFFPGGKIDGICGYRTRSAMRLFQEYVRSVEKLSCVPDGRFGPSSQQHLQRWMHNRAAIGWAPTIERWEAGTLGQTEYTEWLSLLGRVKDHYTSNPNRALELVNAFAAPTDTRPVARWDFSPKGNIHLVGIRRNELSNKFDDIFVLLIKGLVFKFQGSTEPGASDNPAGAPFLVQGQHDYHFGWHKKQYLALRPEHLDKGVLVVRSKDMRLDEADLNRGLEANASINIHWGGKGMKFDVKNWSEGCQVINGTAYIGPSNELIDCSAFAAVNNSEIATDPTRTRGAYNVLLDLVTALASDLPANTIKYTLLVEQDLDLSPVVKDSLADARAKAARFLD
jgi:peptidoglycan hydrolase-like protein with peptidoglycan-binding domain